MIAVYIGLVIAVGLSIYCAVTLSSIKSEIADIWDYVYNRCDDKDDVK